jgi:hypothetical protein
MVADGSRTMRHATCVRADQTCYNIADAFALTGKIVVSQALQILGLEIAHHT